MRHVACVKIEKVDKYSFIVMNFSHFQNLFGSIQIFSWNWDKQSNFIYNIDF